MGGGKPIDFVVGANLRAAREACGLTREAVALDTSIACARISAIEVGAIRPTPEELLNLSRILGIGLAALFVDPNDPVPDRPERKRDSSDTYSD